jgi:hypothetical protein
MFSAGKSFLLRPGGYLLDRNERPRPVSRDGDHLHCGSHDWHAVGIDVELAHFGHQSIDVFVVNFRKKGKRRFVYMAAKKAAFGGYSINFKGRQETLEEVFGKNPIGPSEMTKKIWAFVKAKKLAGK